MPVQERSLRTYISRDIAKLGAMIPSVNLPVGKTCRKFAPCAALCYAKRGRFSFPNVTKRYRENFERYLEDPDGYFADIAAWLQLNPVRYFRFHSSGDIVDEYYFEKMVQLADQHREIKFLVFTKKYEIVNGYIEEHRELPNNLTVVLSCWGSWKPENPFHLPMSYVDLKDGSAKIPGNAIKCSGYCGECVSGLQNCWNLKLGKSVVFRQH